MTSPEFDPLDEGVPRGRYGRPLIIPANRAGKPNLKAPLVEYDRASTVADALDDGGGIGKWETRHAASGIAANPDLAALVAALGRNPDTFTKQEKAYLDSIIERAHDRSGGNEKADYGTAVHSLTEPGNGGTVVIESMTGDVASYLATIDEAGIEVDATETFVVNDGIKVAGTFDHVYRLTRDLTVKVNGVEVTLPAGTKLIGDKKTGSLHFDAHAIQLAIYARGKKYNHVTGERSALDVSPQWGIVAHVGREAGKTTLYLVDIADGWNGAKLAVEVRAYKLGARKRLSTAIASVTVEPAPLPDVNTDPLAESGAVAVPTADSGNATVPPPAEPAPAEPVEAVTAPEPAPPADEVAEARALVEDTFGPVTDVPDPILAKISNATGRDACHAIWQDCRREGVPWHDEYTAAVEARLASLPVPA